MTDIGLVRRQEYCKKFINGEKIDAYFLTLFKFYFRARQTPTFLEAVWNAPTCSKMEPNVSRPVLGDLFDFEINILFGTCEFIFM